MTHNSYEIETRFYYHVLCPSCGDVLEMVDEFCLPYTECPCGFLGCDKCQEKHNANTDQANRTTKENITSKA